MNSKNNYKWIVRITFVGLFFLLIFPIQFSGSAIAEPEKSPEEFNENGNIYLPASFFNYPRHPFFGAEATIMLVEGEPLYTKTVALNLRWLRLNSNNGISWRELQPNPRDEINWDLLVEFENQLRSLQALGITPVISLNDSPLWAVDPSARSDGKPSSCGPIHPDKFDEFADFLREIINRYKIPEFDVHNWEIGNEPDVDPDLVSTTSVFGCWGDIDDTDYYGGKKYGEMLKNITPIIKSVDPSAKVWIGGLLLAVPETTDPKLGKPERFLRGILEAGAGSYFDYLAYHGHLLYYGDTIDSDTHLSGPWIERGGGVLGKARYLRQIMKEYNVDKPLILGEIGIGCRNDFNFCVPSPDAEFFQYQADMLVRVAARITSEDIRGFTWYQINGEGWRNQGLLDADNNPRPAYDAYQQLILQLGDVKFLAPIDYGSEVEGYSYKQNSNKVHVVWTKEDKSVDILIPISKFIDAFDRDGNQISSPPVEGSNYKINVGFSPIYIIRK
jgi:hypothetical protein